MPSGKTVIYKKTVHIGQRWLTLHTRGMSAKWGRCLRRGDVTTCVLTWNIFEGSGTDKGPVHKAHGQFF